MLLLPRGGPPCSRLHLMSLPSLVPVLQAPSSRRHSQCNYQGPPCVMAAVRTSPALCACALLQARCVQEAGLKSDKFRCDRSCQTCSPLVAGTLPEGGLRGVAGLCTGVPCPPPRRAPAGVPHRPRPHTSPVHLLAGGAPCACLLPASPAPASPAVLGRSHGVQEAPGGKLDAPFVGLAAVQL